MERTASGSYGIAAIVGSIISILMVVNGVHPLPFLDTIVNNKDTIIADLSAVVGAIVVLYTAASSPPTWLRQIFFWKKPLPPAPPKE